MIPRVPIYPGSTLTTITDTTDPKTADAFGGMRYHYKVDESAERVRDFYEKAGTCWTEPDYCEGRAKPFGIYKVSIISEWNTYIIEVAWDKCPARVLENSVEH
jgi:hypothetical protein